MTHVPAPAPDATTPRAIIAGPFTICRIEVLDRQIVSLKHWLDPQHSGNIDFRLKPEEARTTGAALVAQADALAGRLPAPSWLGDLTRFVTEPRSKPDAALLRTFQSAIGYIATSLAAFQTDCPFAASCIEETRNLLDEVVQEKTHFLTPAIDHQDAHEQDLQDVRDGHAAIDTDTGEVTAIPFERYENASDIMGRVR